MPITCTLPPAEYRERTRALADLAARALRERQPTADGERLTFGPEVEPELRAALAAERSCCAFLRTELTRIEHGLLLDVSGPADARPLIAELFA